MNRFNALQKVYEAEYGTPEYDAQGVILTGIAIIVGLVFVLGLLIGLLL